MDINRGGAQQNSRYLAARFHEKGCLQVLGGDALSSAQYGSLQKYFSHPSFTYLLKFSNPTQKTKTGTAKVANRWETTNSIHLHQSSETGSTSHIIFITLYSNRS
jgi:hypothetical protein